MRDVNMALRSTTASVTQTETGSWVEIQGTPAIGWRVISEIPKQSAGDTLAAVLQYSPDASNAETNEEVELWFLASVTVTTTPPVRKVTKTGKWFKYARVVLTAAGTSPDYGAVSIWIEPYGEGAPLDLGQF